MLSGFRTDIFQLDERILDGTAYARVPPGNPDNAHEICVGKSAVDPHVDNHGDYLGPCVPHDGDEPPPPSGDVIP